MGLHTSRHTRKNSSFSTQAEHLVLLELEALTQPPTFVTRHALDMSLPGRRSSMTYLRKHVQLEISPMRSPGGRFVIDCNNCIMPLKTPTSHGWHSLCRLHNRCIDVSQILFLRC